MATAVRDALIVGIDAYPAAPLSACVHDAEEFEVAIALEQYGFNCKHLYNRSATRSAILDELGELVYGEDRRDFLLFYFAGHGQVLGHAGHLVAVDGKPYDPGISLAQLGQLMESASLIYDHVLAILDCCHSGSAITWVNSRPVQGGDIEREVTTINESRCVLAACRPEQLAFEEPSSQHGYFTARLIEGLLGNAVNFDGDVTLLGLYEYTARSVPESVQTPVFKGDLTGTVVIGSGFTPRVGSPIDKKEMNATLAKAQRLVDEYATLRQRELRETDYKRSAGWLHCAQELGPILGWFVETEQALPDIVREQTWQSLTAQIRDYRKDLSDLSVGTNTMYGPVRRSIGHGGYGQVWEVRQPSGPELALKVFHGNELDQVTKVRRFINGYENMRKLDHPRIVGVHELSLAPLGFTMDAIPGDDLRKAYIHRDDPEQVLRLLIEVAETIQHAHSRGVKHRDIKPENIIVVTDTDSGALTPFLTDFDLAYHETNRTLTTNLGVGGVINYAAPEQLYEPNTSAARSEAVDIFSLAQLLFFVVVGRDPSADRFEDNVALLVKSLNSWVEDRAAAPLIRLYQQATAKRPEDRVLISDYIDQLASAEAVVVTASGREDLDEEDFCRRLAHLYAGLGNFSATDRTASMNSLSGQVNISVRLVDFQERRGVSIELDLSVADKIPIPSLKSGSSGRTMLNTRLGRALKKYSNVRRENGKKGQYQVFVTAEKLPLTMQGVVAARDILQTAVSGIEAW